MKLFSRPKRTGVFENKALLKIIASKKGVATKDHRELQNETLHKCCASPNAYLKNVMDKENNTHGRDTNWVAGPLITLIRGYRIILFNLFTIWFYYVQNFECKIGMKLCVKHLLILSSSFNVASLASGKRAATMTKENFASGKEYQQSDTEPTNVRLMYLLTLLASRAMTCRWCPQRRCGPAPCNEMQQRRRGSPWFCGCSWGREAWETKSWTWWAMWRANCSVRATWN